MQKKKQKVKMKERKLESPLYIPLQDMGQSTLIRETNTVSQTSQLLLLLGALAYHTPPLVLNNPELPHSF
jgi:hypothetical protein